MANMANMKPPKAFYNVVQVQQNTKMCKILKCKEWHFISVCLQKIDANKDYKRHKVDTIESKTHDKSSQAKKLILKPKKNF